MIPLFRFRPRWPSRPLWAPPRRRPGTNRARRGAAALTAALALTAVSAPAVAYEDPSGAGTGVQGKNGYRVLPFPSGMEMTAAVSGNNDVLQGLTLSAIGSPAASNYQPQVNPATAWAANIKTVPAQNCPANSTCPAGVLTLIFKHPVRDPILNIGGLGAGLVNNGVNGGAYTQLRLTGTDQPATIGPANAGATLLVDGQTIRPRSRTARANCQDADVALRAGCGSVPVQGTVKSLTFLIEFVTQNVGAASDASNGNDQWTISSVVRNDCSNAPASYGNASHVLSDLTLGRTVGEDVANTSITQACRADGSANDLNPDFSGLNVDQAGKTYSLTVPVNGVSADAYAAAWIDFTGSGSFSTAQRATAAVAPGQTSATFTWTVPAGVVPGPTWSRFRLGYDQAQVESATGMADSGEVEDWPLRIIGPAKLTLAKSADPATVAKAGETVTYSFKVTNSGDVPVTDVRIDESAFSGTGGAPRISCPTGSVAPGDSVTCTARYTVTQADVNAGRITNTATATATPPAGMRTPVSDPSTTTVTATPSPALTLDKTVAETGALRVGEVLHYSFLLTNTGNVTLTGAGVDEGTFTGSGGAPKVTCPPEAATLAPGATATCTAQYTVTQADVDAGKISNTATGTGTPPGGGTPVTSPPSSTVVPFAPTPSLELDKKATPATTGKGGDTVTYAFTVTNTGNVTLTDVTVAEGAFTGTGTMSAVTCPAGAKSLAPGAQIVCTATYTLTQADADAGKVDNAATATGTPPGGGTPVTSPPGSSTVTVPPAPALTVDKSSDRTGIVAGETITYAFTVTNTGNVTLTNVGVNETSWTGSGPAPQATCPDGATSLAPGAQVVCTATYTVTQADADRGTLHNAATTTGTPPGGNPPVTSPPSSVDLPHDSQPALSLAKKATPATVGKAGDTVTYTFTATNTGNVTLTDVTVAEGAFTGTGTMSAVACPPGATSLAPGQKTDCTATYTVTQADVDAGKIDNSATATGTPPGGGTPVTSPPGTTEVTAKPAPGLTIAKKADPATAGRAGDTITYSFTATNTGNVTLTNVSVTEGAFSGTGTMSAVTCPEGAKSLAPGAQVVCTTTYTVTQADVDAGKIDNSATATGTPPGGGTPVTSPPGTTTVTVPPAPGLGIAKSSDTNDLKAGETVTYSFTVTNTGNVTLANVAVAEGSFSGAGKMSAITCPDAAKSLAPGAQVVCTATYTVTQADVDRGSIGNSATATGTPPGGGTPVTSPPGTTTVPSQPAPALSVVKSSDRTQLVAGETITYAFTVTNTGNVTLADVTVAEGAFTGSGTMPAATCPDGAKSLAPGAQVVCTAAYTVTQADADRGTLHNAATATGTPPGGNPPVTSPPSSVDLPHDSRPALSITKAASPALVHKAGDTVTYTFTITNTGNVTVKDAAVAEGSFSGTGGAPQVTCPDAAKSLVPGQKVVCTAVYTATQADVDAGRVDNTATATGTPPGGGTPVTSPPATTEFSSVPAPGLSVVKSSDKSDLVAGETITYAFTVTNTGNVTLHAVTVTEGRFSGSGTLSPVRCPEQPLAPGAQLVCTATYVVTQADVDHGSLTNSVTATGTPPHGDPVTSPPSDAKVPATPTAGLELVKKASTDRAEKAGQVITYTFTLTNTGNVTLTQPAVQEGEFSGHGTLSPATCPDGPLAPGRSLECTATYTVTAADLTGRPLRNTATATSHGPDGNPVVSDPSTATVDAPAPVPPLPPTGGHGELAGTAAVLVLTGGALSLLVVRQRRRREQ